MYLHALAPPTHLGFSARLRSFVQPRVNIRRKQRSNFSRGYAAYIYITLDTLLDEKQTDEEKWYEIGDSNKERNGTKLKYCSLQGLFAKFIEKETNFDILMFTNVQYTSTFSI